MKKIMTIVMVLAIATVASTIFAQDGSFVKTAVAPVIDGAIDAAWTATNPNVYSNFAQFPGNTLSGAGDLDVQFRAMWDDTNLYILVEVTDNYLNRDSGASGWLDDSIEIYTDVNDLNTDPYTNGGAGGIFQTTEAIELGQSNPFTPTDIAGPVAGMVMQMVLTGTAGNPGTYTLEASLPWAGLGGGYTPLIGNQIGFGVAVNDADNAGNTRQTQLVWATSAGDLWQNASSFPTVELIGIAASGDVNVDGVVNILDATTIIGNLGMSDPQRYHGDLNNDNAVTVADLDIVKANWGFGLVAEPPVEPIPEPATLGLLLVGGLLVLRRKR